MTLKKLDDLLFELEQDAWESGRTGVTYHDGYWYGVYWTCRKIREEFLDLFLTEIIAGKYDDLLRIEGG